MEHKSKWIVISTAATLALTAACTDRGDQAGIEGDQRQVIEESYTRQSNQIGQPTERQGEADVKGSREIVTRTQEKVQEEIPTVVEGKRMADINRMDVEDFRALGLPEETAQSIIEFREQQVNDRFSSLDQLARVPGMDMTWLNQNRGSLAVSGEAAGQVE